MKSEFRDPIHGFIAVYEHEKQIIETWEFQRLRRIHQLGLQSYCYHGAEHSRFGHSLGVMHLAGEAVERIFEKNRTALTRNLRGDKAKERAMRKQYFAARLAGLLHDLGHAPFSHPGEKKLFPEKDGKQLTHEDYSVPIIRSSEISSIIDHFSPSTEVTSEDVKNVIDKNGLFAPSYVRSLISSPWDVDKMDYLLRDSFYCGVEYGKFDLKRLIGSLTLDGGYQSGSPELAIESGGMHTVEALLLARYFMFTQVYFHDVRRAFDIILTDFIGDCLEEQYGDRFYPAPDRIGDYLQWDDYSVLSQAKQKADKKKRNSAWRIVERKHYKAVYETLPHTNPMVQARVLGLKKECEKKFSGASFWLDRAEDHPERFKRQDMPIMVAGGQPPKSLAQESAALRGLEQIGQCRIYADVREDDTLSEEITKYCNDFMR